MKNLGFIYSSDSQLEEIIRANELCREDEYLIRIHTCIHTAETIMPFVEKIMGYFPNSKVIGTSTSGVILKGEIITDVCLVSITSFDAAEITTSACMIDDGNGHDVNGKILAEVITSDIVNQNTKFMIAFASHPFEKIDEFVEGINKFCPNVKVIGGIANTPQIPLIDMTRYESFAFNESGVHKNSIVCASISSKKLSVYSNVIYVTEPVGDLHTITESDGCIIRSIDGKNAVEWYQDMLGINFAEEEDPGSITNLFPIVNPERSNVPWAINYSAQTEDRCVFPNEPEPIMFTPSEAKAGDVFRMSYSSVQKTVDVCETVCENINKNPSEVLIGYSCVSRQEIFNNCAKWELMPFEKTNLCGALVAGEFGNIENVNCYCCYTFAIASLAENNSYSKIDTEIIRDRANELVQTQEKILDYLVSHSGSDSGIVKHHEIEKKLFIDSETGLENLTKYIFDFNKGLFDKICMITIKNESLIKAFMSESKFFLYLNRFYKAIIEHINDENYGFYVYKDTYLVVTGNDKITESAFIDKMQDLQTFLLEFKFSSYVPVSEFSIVMREENLIKKAELTLARMRAKKSCFLTYTPDMGLEQFNAQKMKMIVILNNAISNDLVIPYFQGIRDNATGEIQMYESLMRIEDMDGNVYTPYHFMDIAKEYGYYADISEIMIKKVMNIFRDKDENVTINMNISDIYNYKIVSGILEFLKSAPHPEHFIFELTETEEIDDYQIIFEFVEKVHAAGGKIAIDDFGSGFSNIVHIFKIPSDYIKIDGEIIKNITCDVYAKEFLEMISDWSRKHSKEIIAEFVENMNIQDIIEKNGIHFSQGYLYSKPEKRFEKKKEE